MYIFKNVSTHEAVSSSISVIVSVYQVPSLRSIVATIAQLVHGFLYFICILSFVMPCPGTWRRTMRLFLPGFGVTDATSFKVTTHQRYFSSLAND